MVLILVRQKAKLSVKGVKKELEKRFLKSLTIFSSSCAQFGGLPPCSPRCRPMSAPSCQTGASTLLRALVDNGRCGALPDMEELSTSQSCPIYNGVGSITPHHPDLWIG